MAKLQTYKILRSQGLSVPPDLKAEIEGGAPGEAPPGGMGGAPGITAPPGGGMGGPMGTMPMPGGGGGGMGGTVMPPPPMNAGRGGPTGVLDTGAPGGARFPGAAGGPGYAPQVSYDRMRGMPTPVSAVIMGSSVPLDEQILLGSVSDEDIDARIHQAGQVLVDIEFRKKMRRTARDQNKLRAYEVEDGDLLKLSTSEKIVIDKVPPQVRRNILNAT
jgi:hypothetical protein